MTNKRDVWVGDEKARIWKAARDTELYCELRMVRRGKNWVKVVVLLCGARPVRLAKESVVMWLVSARYKGSMGGRFYFLTNLDKTRSVVYRLKLEEITGISSSQSSQCC